MSSTVWSWVFEARSIQEYLFETGRLSDAVGASLLVDQLTGDLSEPEGDDLLSHVLAATQANATIQFSRRGGGAFAAFCPDQTPLKRVRALWMAALAENAPGLRWRDALRPGRTAREAVRAALQAVQQRSVHDPASLPEAAASHLRVPRTGHAAASFSRVGGETLEPVDAATVARQRHRRKGLDVLTRRFAEHDDLHWPTDLSGDATAEGDGTAFPFLGSDREVAFLHADGNGLGLLLRQLDENATPEGFIEQSARFSQAISEATRAAAQRATLEVLLPATHRGVVPARPLILGGDDLLVIVRADLALDFAEAFLKAFEAETAQRLQPLADVLKLAPGKGLTAACGVLVAKANYPFSAAAQGAHQLCDQAKRAIKSEARNQQRAMPLSALALAQVDAAQLSTEPAQAADGRRLGLPAYVLEASPHLPQWPALRQLAQALGDAATPSGPARRLLTDLHTDLDLARERYRRMQEVQKVQWPEIAAALQALRVPQDADLPFVGAASPWPDALLVRDLMSAVNPTKEAA